MAKLDEYKKKRDFSKTKEPVGKVKPSGKKLCFAVQHHLARADHYDFRLEWNGVLLSWAVPKGPSFNPKDKRLAVRVEDHPLDYADFEGTIPKGEYGGGTVMLWDIGEWEPLEDVEQGLKRGILKFCLYGKRLKGNWFLAKLNSDDENWLLIKEKDEYAKEESGIEKFDTSVKTNRTMTEIEQNKSSKKNFAEIKNQLKQLLTIEKNTYSIGGVTISNPNKIVFEKPKIKKIDVILYYAYVSKYMLPFVKNRLLTAVRCPKGVSDACFFKKHPNESNKNVSTLKIGEEQEEFYYLTDEKSLINEAQMGTLEFHIWGSQVKKLEKPDVMVFDLDPSENLNIKKLRQGVKHLKSILDELGLVSFLKTSGGKGYHIVVPFKPSVSWEKFNKFAKNVAVIMEKTWPNLYTSNIRKEKRKGKIFIDYMRNGKGATSVAPYSLRAREGAPISMPIAWEDLEKYKPKDITIKNFYKVLEQNPWKNFFDVKQTLK